MGGRIRRCPADNIYTLSLTCPQCGKPTAIAHPARFSPEDKYGKYRRLAHHD
jgi:H/ACA ribonucleoprotein complex subunit 3